MKDDPIISQFVFKKMYKAKFAKKIKGEAFI